MDEKSDNNWDSMVLVDQIKRSSSPNTPKGSWQIENNMEVLKKRLEHFHNISQENIRS